MDIPYFCSIILISPFFFEKKKVKIQKIKYKKMPWTQGLG
jgi:hypothetical protein